MKYVANPVEVEAHKIVSIGLPHAKGVRLELENGESVTASPEMLSRIHPVLGDYLGLYFRSKTSLGLR
jgi:hypothetical protein